MKLSTFKRITFLFCTEDKLASLIGWYFDQIILMKLIKQQIFLGKMEFYQ